ncbi:hypothetical protein THRCLA_05132 [Thraustotheca clavata]|uniref:Secreted protein n=1 Tax=Thraustotheca clavata TaxID=74557 RepID=A0A0A7CM58_9STRA|nr:secreted protein [Thraustotheca clavata]OQS02495.1 hypothetical protein THRCLA_05132 [Thraustotheca clavata]
MHSIIVLSILAMVAAKPQFVALLPNGGNVPGVNALGHVDPAGGGSRNNFGKDFSSNGLSWNKALCQLDSDGDGATNGEELLDPCCTWSNGATLASTATPTHPGVKNTFTSAQLAALKCQTSVAASNSTNNASTVPSSGVATPTTAKPTSGAGHLATPLAAVALAAFMA